MKKKKKPKKKKKLNSQNSLLLLNIKVPLLHTRKTRKGINTMKRF